MTQGYLIFVPSVKQFRKVPASTLMEFKAAHGIHTLRSPGLSKEEHPWLAMLLPSDKQLIPSTIEGVTDPVAIISRAGRWMEEAGYLTFGITERHALRLLCEANGIEPPI